MAETCSHQDSSRRQVSSTAHLIAHIRGLVKGRLREESWYHDSYAEVLGGEVGRKVWKEAQEKWSPLHAERFQQAMFTRTKVIDDFVKQCLAEGGGLDQILVFGGGLDTRAWRLHPTLSRPVSYFEIDFPEVFAYKLSILQSQGAQSDFDYHAVTADLSLPGEVWMQTLTDAGFSTAPNARTLIIMEGFANYLTDAELCGVLQTISAAVSVDSKFISTCITPQASHVTLSTLHRFLPDRPLEVWGRYGWVGRQDDLVDLAEHLLASHGQVEEKSDSIAMPPLDADKSEGDGRGYFILRLTKESPFVMSS